MRFNRVTRLNGIQWRYDIHGRTVEKDNGQTRWRYRYDGEHRLTDVISQPRDRNKPQVEVSFRYDPLGRRISKTRRQSLAGQPTGKTVTARFVWEGFRLLQEIHDEVPLTYVYCDQHSYDPDCGRFTQHDPIGLAGGINLYQFAPNALGWVDPWGVNPCKPDKHLPDAEPGQYNYRGVHKDHPEWENALNGKVVPGDVHSSITPEQHNFGGYQKSVHILR